MAASTKMTATERKEIRRLVDERFDLLDQQARTHEQHIANTIEENLMEQAQDVIKDAEKETEELAKELEQLFSEHERKLEAINEKWVAIRRKYEERGLKSDYNPRYRLTDGGELNYIEWEPKGISQVIKLEMAKLRAERGDATLNLATIKNEMLTDLTLGAVVSDEGRNFLDRIPKIETLLIPEADIQQIAERAAHTIEGEVR